MITYWNKIHTVYNTPVMDDRYRRSRGGDRSRRPSVKANKAKSVEIFRTFKFSNESHAESIQPNLFSFGEKLLNT